jgi:hypothetical protein
MLILSLILSWVLLCLVNGVVRLPRYPVLAAFICLLAFLIGQLSLTNFLPVFLPTVVLQVFLLCGALAAWSVSQRRPRLFLQLSCLATVVAYGITGCSALYELQQNIRLREQYPLESLEGRLPTPRRPPREGTLSVAAARRLDQLEDEFHRESSFSWGRERYLRRLHEGTVALFVNSPGFGVTRMSGIDPESLARGVRTEPPVPQPESAVSTGGPSGNAEGNVRPSDNFLLLELHRDGLMDFLHPAGFGYLKDHRSVAGFQAHHFSRAPKPVPYYLRLQTLDLVGLVVHEAPVAYVSAHLPRMDELREAPTRPLDGFESAGLAALRGGEDLVVREANAALRMLGAIRSTKQCLACHGGERGDLLGCFSYTFRRPAP